MTDGLDTIASVEPKRALIFDLVDIVVRAFATQPGNSQTDATGTLAFFTHFFAEVSERKPSHVVVVCLADPLLLLETSRLSEGLFERARAQVQMTRETLDALGVDVLDVDDVYPFIHQMQATFGSELYVFSSDRRAIPFVAQGTRLIDPIQNRRIDQEWVRKRYGIDAARFHEFLALSGDKRYAINGVRGVGPKTAAKFINLASSFCDSGSSPTLFEVAAEDGKKAALAVVEERARLVADYETLRSPAKNDHNVPPHTAISESVRNEVMRALGFLSLLVDESNHERISVDGFREPVRVKKVEVNDEKGAQAALQAFFSPTDSQGFAGCYLHDGGGDICVTLANDRAALLLRGAACVSIGGVLSSPDAKIAVWDLQLFYYLLALPSGLETNGNVLDLRVASYLYDATGLLPHDLGPVVKAYAGAALPIATTDNASDDRLVTIAQLVARAAHTLSEKLVTHNLKAFHDTISLRMAGTLAEMKRTGVVVSSTILEELEAEFSDRKNAIEDEIQSLAQRPINPGSTKQLGELLFEELGLPITKRTKTGYSTASDVLEVLTSKHAIPGLVLRWRSLAKLINTYTRVLREAAAQDGRVRATYQQTASSSGRLISTNPDLQRTPVHTEDGKRIRKAFVAPKGFLLLAADWSQIELRLLATISQDAALLDAFARGADVHKETAATIFDCDVQEITNAQRHVGKTVNFATIYGQGARSLGKLIGCPQKDAQKMIDAYFERFCGRA